MIDPSTLQAGLGLSTRGELPADLLGQWRLRSPGPRSTGMQFYDGGLHFIALRPETFGLNADASKLTLGGNTYSRIWGSNNLEGYWVPDAGGDHIALIGNRGWFIIDDNTFESFLYFTSGNQLQFWPLRSIVDTGTSIMTFYPVYRTVSGELPFTLVGDVFTWTLPDGTALIYDREPIGFQ